MKRIVIFSCILLLGLAHEAGAQSDEDWTQWPLVQRYSIGVGAYFPSLDTKVSVSVLNGLIGTEIDFEQTLGMSGNESMPVLYAAWRFAKKHRLNFQYFKLNRSGAEATGTTIRFGDQVFNVDLPLASYFDIEAYALSYSYSLLLDPKKELAIGLGLSMQDVGFGLRGTALTDIGEEFLHGESTFTAPLPTLAIDGGYAFTDKWTFRAGLGYFAVELELSDEKDLSGLVLESYATIFHQTFEHVRFGAGWSYFKVDVDYTKNRRDFSLEYDYSGPVILMAVDF